MKKIFCSAILISFFLFGYTQQSLPVSTDKTVTLIFPFPVTYYDHGSNALLIQQVPLSENILMVKASTIEMKTTSLSVVCKDGNVYSFRVQYDSMPPVWTWNIPPIGEVNINTYAVSILDNPATRHHPFANDLDISISIIGIYVRNDIMYYQLSLKNGSPIDYNVEVLQFFIRDRKKSRRTATQETTVPVSCSIGNYKLVKANDNNTIVIAIAAMTLAHGKYLGVQLLEKNGGRNLLLKIKNRHLLKAIPLPGIIH